MEEVQILQEVQVDEADLFDVDLWKQAQDVDEYKKKQEVKAFGASVQSMVKPVTTVTSVTETNDTVTNDSVTSVTNDSDPWLLPHEAAVMLGVTRKTVRDWYNRGILSGIITSRGQHLRIRTSEVYRLQGRRYTPPEPNPYDDPRILAEAQATFDTEDDDSIFSETNLQQAIQTRR